MHTTHIALMVKDKIVSDKRGGGEEGVAKLARDSVLEMFYDKHIEG